MQVQCPELYFPNLLLNGKLYFKYGSINQGVSEQILQTVWINKQQNPDHEITAEMLKRPVGGAERRLRKADVTSDGGSGLPAEDSTAAM